MKTIGIDFKCHAHINIREDEEAPTMEEIKRKLEEALGEDFVTTVLDLEIYEEEK